MAKAENKYTYEQISKDLSEKKYFPLYFLCGEEPYYIDKISDFIEKNILSDEEKDMNLTILYGKEVKIEEVISAARRFPVLSDYQVVIVKEAQNLKRNIEKIEKYAQNPLNSTILVICYKYEKPDGRKKYAKLFSEKGVLFESATIYDNHVPKFINDFCQKQKIKIDSKAVNMLTEFIGNDLSRIVSEIDKLLIVKPKEVDIITAELVEKNVGISKNYNAFELAKALGQRNILLANRIIDYFGKNPKEFAIQPALTTLNNYFLNVFFYQRLKQKEENISVDFAAQRLGLNPYFFQMQYLPAAQNYNPTKIREIISEIRKADARSKGFGGIFSDKDILKELVFSILH